MSCRHYFYTLIIVLVNCASLFHRQSEFDRALEQYQKSNFLEAAKYFRSHYGKNPGVDTTLYYLFNCYRHLNQPEQEIRVLTEFAKIGSIDENVYLNLFYYYRKMSRYRELFEFLSNATPFVESILNKHYVLTRNLYAEIICGATKKQVYSGPMIFAVTEGYISIYPDGKFYDNDTITNGNLIILLDQLVNPFYPKKLYKMKNISNNSFLYLPYLRLVDLTIIEFDPELNPDKDAGVTTAAKAIAKLKIRGLID